TDDADAQRSDHRVPARFLVRHANVVAIAEVEAAVGDPPELDRLALDGLAGHPLDLAEDLQRLTDADDLRVLEQDLHGQHVGSIADVHRDGHPVRLEQRHLAPAELGAVLDVVVDEEGVVEQLESSGGEQRLLGAAAHRPARREQDGRPQPLALAKRIVGEQVVERAVARPPPAREKPLELALRVLTCLSQRPTHEIDVVGHERSPASAGAEHGAVELGRGAIARYNHHVNLARGPLTRLADLFLREMDALTRSLATRVREAVDDAGAVLAAPRPSNGGLLTRLADLGRANWFRGAEVVLDAHASAGPLLPSAAARWPRQLRVAVVAADLSLAYATLRERARQWPSLVHATDWELQHRRGAARVAAVAASLGGLLIKAGQIASARPDLVPAAYVEQLAALQDRVPPRPWHVIAPEIARALGRPPAEVFESFDPAPTAAASLC